MAPWDVSTHDTADLCDTNFRESLLEYNKLDCLSLFEVISTFNKLVKKSFGISIFKYPTLPSLAFNLYRKKFMPKNAQIPITFAENYPDFKACYKWCHVVVYQPYGKNLFYYDVNSLYPYVMSSFRYPIGKTIYFEGSRPLEDLNLVMTILVETIVLP